MTRRDFIKASVVATTGAVLASRTGRPAVPTTGTQPRIPRGRGFNLTELAGGRPNQTYRESDFAWMAE